jgi:molybdopterin/thiamine biosynthesis adenylyltransferase
MLELRTDHLTRQLDIIPMSALDKAEVNIIGCGAIGSYLALSLVKMGVERIKLWDMDDVSVENMSSQFYRFKDIGRNKAEALAELIKDFTGVEVEAYPLEYMSMMTRQLKGIVVVAVDSMSARAMIYESLTTCLHGVRVLIDPRMSAEFYMQYTVDLENHEWYKKSLYTDDNAVSERCTAKSTVYTATLASGMVTKTIKNIMLKQPYPKSINWDIAASGSDSMSMYAGNF